ncbi:MAG: hypothetical protein R3B70_14320 [Polyangiaceae bacterium]
MIGADGDERGDDAHEAHRAEGGLADDLAVGGDGEDLGAKTA